MKKSFFLHPAKLICLILIAFLMTSCANSNFLLDRGKKSYNEERYRQAFIRLEPVAKAGNPDAQYAVGFMYFNGQGVTEDKKVGIEWMKKAASQNNLKAIQALSIIRKTKPSPYQPRSRSIIGNGR
jgi:TPR repeat protein